MYSFLDHSVPLCGLCQISYLKTAKVKNILNIYIIYMPIYARHWSTLQRKYDNKSSGSMKWFLIYWKLSNLNIGYSIYIT